MLSLFLAEACAVVLSCSAFGGREFEKCGAGAIAPRGFMAEFLNRQVSGTTGRHAEIGYPFDGCMWAGSISNVYFEEDLPYSRKIAAPRRMKSIIALWT